MHKRQHMTQYACTHSSQPTLPVPSTQCYCSGGKDAERKMLSRFALFQPSQCAALPVCRGFFVVKITLIVSIGPYIPYFIGEVMHFSSGCTCILISGADEVCPHQSEGQPPPPAPPPAPRSPCTRTACHSPVFSGSCHSNTPRPPHLPAIVSPHIHHAGIFCIFLCDN